MAKEHIAGNWHGAIPATAKIVFSGEYESKAGEAAVMRLWEYAIGAGTWYLLEADGPDWRMCWRKDYASKRGKKWLLATLDMMTAERDFPTFADAGNCIRPVTTDAPK